ncbi:amino acid adenylation domain-containing protein [Streptomyces sp. NPDC048623]|uniref:amino acid adenylation domain-containing protein n=1 Tax=Streptomyces sp. NPDC048623 TaxID=3155761 RepID=UPI003427D380
MNGSTAELTFRLTPAQERLWFLHRLDPQDTSYHMFWALRLRGQLDLAALRAAVADLVARHEPLRTRCTEQDGIAYGIVAPAGVLPELDLLDLSGEPDPEAAVAAQVRGRLEEPFDLTAGAPVRTAVYTLGPDHHVLSVVLHHIAGDGWSLGVWSAELPARYNAHRAGGALPQPALPQPYHRYAARSRERAGADREFWLERLAGAPVLNPPGARPQALAAVADPAGAFHTVPLPPGLVRRVRALARAERSTVFLVLLTAFQTLLSRWTGQEDLCVGTPVAGRDRVEDEPLFGYLSGTVVLRADLTGEPAFRELLRRSRRAFFDAYPHPEVPFEELGAGPAGPFQALFVVNGAASGGPAEDFDGLRAEGFWSGNRQVKAPLTLDVWDALTDADDGLQLVLGHRLALFDEAAGARLAGHLATLLAHAVDHPELPFRDLDLTTAREQAALVEAGRGPEPPQPAPDVLERFRQQAARTPDSPAVRHGGRTLLYGELARLVDERAAELRRLGVRPGEVVAVCRERGPGLVVDLLAVLAADAAYTCLDPADPEVRRERLTRRCGAVLRLTDDGAVPLPTGSGQLQPGLAYLCHTSGSTGEPKAVMVTRAGLAARVRWMAAAYGLGPADRVLQFANPAFDTHAEEIFPALASGAVVVLLPGGGELLPDFLRTPEGAGLTVLDLPTSYWHALTAQPDTAWPPALRLLVLGGEAARGDTVTAWRAAVGDGPRLVNTYGPTEATVIATAAELAAGQTTDADPPIGRPLADTRVHVLDAAMRPVPDGVAGELYLGGAGLARGYLGDPARTAERFRPDPFGPPGSRLYATGDRVFRSADGQLHFLGRMDAQLKVRGYRIEPDEVERELTAEPEVRAAAVAVHDQALTAYVVAGPDELTDPSLLGPRLAARLPRRLVPARFIRLERLPLTRSGKVDRAALPAPEPEPQAGTPPRTEAELLVADVWGEVLGLPDIGAYDDFFALGGHSLHALRVAARLAEATGLRLPVRLQFDHRTVAAFAAALEALLLADIESLSDVEVAAALGRTPTLD